MCDKKRPFVMVRFRFNFLNFACRHSSLQLLYQPHPRQELGTHTLHQFAIADRLCCLRRIAVLMPVHLCPVLALFVHKLEQILWHPHLTRADAGTVGNAGYIRRPRDDEHIAIGSSYIASGCHLNRLGLNTTVMFWCLRNHVRQREALCHRLCCRHISSRSHVTTVIAAVFVVGKGGAFC